MAKHYKNVCKWLTYIFKLNFDSIFFSIFHVWSMFKADFTKARSFLWKKEYFSQFNAEFLQIMQNGDFFPLDAITFNS